MVDLLLTNAIILTMDEPKVLRDAYLGVKDKRIVCMGKMTETLPSSAETVDMSGKLLMPGLIDTHGHAGHALARNLGGDDWLGFVQDLYFNCTTEDYWYADARLSYLEKLKFGVTTSAMIIGALPRGDSPEAADAHMFAVANIGLRVCAALGSPNHKWPKTKAVWKGNTRTDVEIHRKDIYQNTANFIKKWNGGNMGRLYAGVTANNLGITGATDVQSSTEDIRELVKISREYGVFLHGHSYRGDIEFLHQNCPEALGKKTQLVHCTGLSAKDIELLAQTQTTAVHAPTAHSNIRERCPVMPMINAGVNVVIGTDGNAPDRSFDIWKDLRAVQTNQRIEYSDATLLPAKQVLEMVTTKAAKALGLESEIGSIAIGKRADIVAINISQAHFAPFNLPIERIVHSTSGADTCDVLVDGEFLMRNSVTLADEKKIIADAKKEQFKALERGGYTKFLQMDE